MTIPDRRTSPPVESGRARSGPGRDGDQVRARLMKGDGCVIASRGSGDVVLVEGPERRPGRARAVTLAPACRERIGVASKPVGQTATRSYRGCEAGFDRRTPGDTPICGSRGVRAGPTATGRSNVVLIIEVITSRLIQRLFHRNTSGGGPRRGISMVAHVHISYFAIPSFPAKFGNRDLSSLCTAIVV